MPSSGNDDNDEGDDTDSEGEEEVVEDASSFQEAAAIVDQKLEHRPPRSELIETNIIQGEANMAPSLQATQLALSKHKMNDNLKLKLKLRPTADDLMDHNILKHPSSPEMGRSTITLLLTEKISHRPTLEELHQQHIM
jgi:hypothetical protein